MEHETRGEVFSSAATSSWRDTPRKGRGGALFGIGTRHVINVLLLSLGFFGLFFAYGTTQNLLSSIVPEKLGYWSLATIYASFCVSSLLVATPVVELLKPKWAMIFGALGYLLFLIANLHPRWWTLIPAAVILGIGAGVIWTGQGAYLTSAGVNYAAARNEPTKSAMGLFNGIFFGIFMLTQVLGNLIGSLILMYGGSDQERAIDILFYCFIGVAAFGIAVFLLLGREKKANGLAYEEIVSDSEGEGNTPRPVKKIPAQGSFMMRTLNNVAQAFLLLRDVRMLLLIPILIYTGLEQGFTFGDFTSDIVKESKGKEWIGYILSVYGLFDALGSVVIGKVADRLGKRVVLAVGVLCHIIFCTFYLVLPEFKDWDFFGSHLYTLFISAAFLGAGDSCFNLFGPIMMGVFFSDKAEAAFSNLKLWQSIGSVAAFSWGPVLMLRYKLVILVAVLLVAISCVVVLDLFVASINSVADNNKQGDEEEETGQPPVFESASPAAVVTTSVVN